jgi:outer membrane protein OmpA-like peptidoglycan-associated protein
MESKLDSVSGIEKYEISNIYFVPDKPIVEPASFFAVDDAAKYLKRFPGCKFEIVGHVNYILPPSVINNPKAMEPAQRLSHERAKTIYELLIERGIPSQSMTFKGVGNSQMVFKNPKNDEEKRKNMRVEILISCKK